MPRTVSLFNFLFFFLNLEHLFTVRISNYIIFYNLDKPFQSEFKGSNTTETNLLDVVDRLHRATESGQASILILLDLCCLQYYISCYSNWKTSHFDWLTNTALNWFCSYSEYLTIFSYTLILTYSDHIPYPLIPPSRDTWFLKVPHLVLSLFVSISYHSTTLSVLKFHSISTMTILKFISAVRSG